MWNFHLGRGIYSRGEGDWGRSGGGNSNAGAAKMEGVHPCELEFP